MYVHVVCVLNLIGNFCCVYALVKNVIAHMENYFHIFAENVVTHNFVLGQNSIVNLRLSPLHSVNVERKYLEERLLARVF